MATRTDDANDNQPLELKPLAIALTRVVQRLENEKSDQRNDEQSSTREKEKDAAENHRRYVEQRVRETQMWERRINPKE